MQSESAAFTNNRRQYWFYDNEGNVTMDSEASYGYDAAGRQNDFSANVFVGGWPTPHPQQPVLEISQTFDGNSTPVKKTTITRSEYYFNEEVQIQEETTHVYYLRSSVLGKIIAELDQAGNKHLGYVFAGGMQIATQYVWNPGYDVGVNTTSPATGSEYMVGGSYLGRKELDPLGADVTEPPPPMLVSEPIFYNPKFADMPIQIEGGPSDEYEQNNADWATMVTATIQAAQERDRAEKLWQSGKRTAAMAILHRNPNVGIEYRALLDGEIVSSGSYFGKAAADFLNGINIALDAELLLSVTEPSGTTRHHLQNPKPDVDDLRDGVEALLKDSRGRCGAFISSLIAGTATENEPR